ncbi:DUF547 domain-containing protein [Rhodovibrionaceae bacterium A322]
MTQKKPLFPLAGAKALLAAFAVVFLTGFGSGERLFAPSSDLWARWQAHDPASTARVNHDNWSAFLQRYLSSAPQGYAQLAYGDVTAEDRSALQAYLGYLAAQPVSGLSRPEQKAYWINLYNALTVSVVLDHYPVESIRDINISPGLFAKGPWGKELISVEGEGLTLNDIEHRILRPIWQDARLHYALNCASIGCPDLQATAFDAVALEGQLDMAARTYVNSPRGVEITGDKITVSKIYDWFIEDFGNSEDGVLAHLQRYAEPDLKADLSRIAKLDAVQYDWALNGPPSR